MSNVVVLREGRAEAADAAAAAKPRVTDARASDRARGRRLIEAAKCNRHGHATPP